MTSTSFETLGLHTPLLKALDKLGYVQATEVQEQTIPAALAEKDVMVSSRTGSGKTAAFLLPILHKILLQRKPDSDTRALILVPTRELALQTLKTFESLSQFTPIKCGLIMGGEAYKHQVATLRKNPEVLIATPGRLVEHIDKGNTYLDQLEILVLDESDRMLDLGFTEAMETIAGACGNAKQTMLFSATLNHKGLKRISSMLDNPEKIEIDSHRSELENIKQYLVLADEDDHKQKLTAQILKKENPNKAFVFCKTREQVGRLGHYLNYAGLKAAFIHSEVSQSERKQIMNSFRNGHLQVLVATDVAARGLDIPELDLVINFSVAQSGDDHVHRIGRTGRAGHSGKAITLVNALEWNLMASIERYLKQKFERTSQYGLTAKFSGPKKLKKSGKAAGNKKPKKTEQRKANKKKQQKTPTKRKLETSKGDNDDEMFLGSKKGFKVSPDGLSGLRKRR